jgi:3-(3-hydroxy-phenyl)propionate hydroxylase
MTAQTRDDLIYRLYPYARVAAQDVAPQHHPVVVVGCGPVGLAMALDLGRQGVPVLLLDDQEGIGTGSRALCFAKRTLEIADRLGAAAPMLEKGVVWNIGKVFHDDKQLYEFNLAPEGGHKFPAFINLPQPYFEKFLHDGISTAQAAGAPIEIRGKNRVDGVIDHGTHVTLDVTTPDGPYQIHADWLVACDGARSPLRGMLGQNFDGRVFEDNFLIADVRMDAAFPTERWFWFAPWFKSGDSALLHKQPDGIWRIDLQLGWDIDRAAELDPARIRARIDKMLGPDVTYELVWTSIYTFQCRRMDKFRVGRVLFAGDAAHQVSPFGARGANSGIQDADNLAWKLKLVLDGIAPDTLVDSYGYEREMAADENILNSTRSTDFITPKSVISRLFRDAALSLAAKAPFARAMVNSGRLSLPSIYDGSPLNGADHPAMPGRTRPGAPVPDAPLAQGWLLNHLGPGFTLLTIDADAPHRISAHGITALRLPASAKNNDSLRARFLCDAASAVYLIRPDQHVAARWGTYDEKAVTRAIGKAIGRI